MLYIEGKGVWVDRGWSMRCIILIIWPVDLYHGIWLGLSEPFTGKLNHHSSSPSPPHPLFKNILQALTLLCNFCALSLWISALQIYMYVCVLYVWSTVYRHTYFLSGGAPHKKGFLDFGQVLVLMKFNTYFGFSPSSSHLGH